MTSDIFEIQSDIMSMRTQVASELILNGLIPSGPIITPRVSVQPTRIQLTLQNSRVLSITGYEGKNTRSPWGTTRPKLAEIY